MPDWASSMEQTFEYYIVDPGTWRDMKRLDNVKSCTINRDLSSETLGSATIDTEESLGENYIRVYLVTIQNGKRERHPLGTFLVQTPSLRFDGKVKTTSVDAYTPLLELKDDKPDIGYSVLKDTNTMDIVYRLAREHMRAPVIKAESEETLYGNFISTPEDTWLTVIRDLAANARFSFDLDEMGRLLFSPKQELAALQPIWVYDDSNASILHPDISEERDLYGIPNVVEVIYSSEFEHIEKIAKNEDPSSPTSIPRRGRIIKFRVTNPDSIGIPTADQVQDYAERLLKELSTLEYKISYTHGYCPVRVGDCVRIDVKGGGEELSRIKAKVISQSIRCEPGCPVSETAVFTTKLWR